LKTKELELAETGTSATVKTAKFDMSKHIQFVPPFQDSEVDKYFLHFEKVVSSFEWPKEIWTLLLQSTLIGKAHEVYSALSVSQNLDYEVVKGAILKAYELVPEAYCQQFRDFHKGEQQTYNLLGPTKTFLITGAVLRMSKLHQLMLLEEFKNCLPSSITTHLDERKADDLHQAAIWTDDYALTHKSTFRRLPPTSGDNTGRGSAAVDHELPSGNALVNPKGSIEAASLVCQLAQCAIVVSVMGMLKPNVRPCKENMLKQ